MHHAHDQPTCTGKQFALVQLPIRDGKEDKAKKGIKGGAQQRQEIAHARDDLCEDKSNDPDNGHDGGPGAPAYKGVAVCVSGFAHDAEIEEFRADVGVDHPDYECGYDDEGEGGFFVADYPQAAECWCCGVLAEVPEADGGWNDEQEG